MAQRRRQSKRAAGRSDLTRAILRGRAQADRVVAFRSKQHRRRSIAVKRAAKRGRIAGEVLPPSRVIRALGSPASAGILIAEGDSWFDYPMHDVLRLLEDEHGYDVESVAHKGDCVEDMAYSDGQFEELARRLEKLLRNGRVPRAILLSGGGNDIAGDEFAIMLNHAQSGLPPMNDDVMRGVVDVRLRHAYAGMLAGLTRICERYLERAVPIITHGYDYPVPDGRGFWGGFAFLPGPWLEPGFREKGYEERDRNTRVMKTLMDHFNAMIRDVSAEFAHVHYLDLRGSLPTDAYYKRYWANELHPTREGFFVVTRKFDVLIRSL